MNLSHTSSSAVCLHVAALAAAVLLAGCAAGGKPKALPPEELVLQRAVERWEHLIDRRFSDAWPYLSPGARSTQPLDRYVAEMSTRRVQWTEVEPVGATCEGEPLVCTSNVKVHYQIRSHLTGVGMVGSASLVTERWILADGQWVHVPEEVVGK